MRISDWSSDVCSSDLDYDNTYEGCPVHSGVVIVPALFAAGEVLKLPAREVAKGVVVGIEIACRLGLVAQKAVHAAGFHPTAILGCLGAAAGVAAAMGQNRTQIRDTLGVAGSMARSEEHTSELQSLMRISYAVFCLKKKK